MSRKNNNKKRKPLVKINSPHPFLFLNGWGCIRKCIESCVNHPFFTGLIAITSLAGFLIDRGDATSSTEQIKGIETIVEDISSELKKAKHPQSFLDKKLERNITIQIPPISKIKIGELFYSQFEISNANYLFFVKANPKWKKGHSNIQRYSDNDYLKYWPAWNEYPKGMSTHPVVYVPWRAATDFCEWVGGRLPTYLEWEIAANNDKDTNAWLDNYPNIDGKEVPLNFCDQPCLEKVNKVNIQEQGLVHEWLGIHDGYDETSPITNKQKMDNSKIYDLYGNVWEWVNDGVTGEYRGTAGGSFQTRIEEIMIKKIRKEKSNLSSKDGGFRCVFK